MMRFFIWRIYKKEQPDLIQAVLFYLFFLSDEIRVRLDDIEDKINKK